MMHLQLIRGYLSEIIYNDFKLMNTIPVSLMRHKLGKFLPPFFLILSLIALSTMLWPQNPNDKWDYFPFVAWLPTFVAASFIIIKFTLLTLKNNDLIVLPFKLSSVPHTKIMKTYGVFLLCILISYISLFI